jgi:hypothetical protein
MAYARGHVLKNATVMIDDVEYKEQLATVLFTPDQPIQQMRTLSPTGTLTDADSAVWTCQMVGIQDFGTGSLGKALRDAAGTLVEIVFQPKVGTGQDVITAEIMALEIPFGGEQGSWRTFDMTFPVSGSPAISQSA